MQPWYKEVGFYSNPFSIKPLAFHDEIFGYNVEGIFSKIENGQILLLEGTYGKGKTTILKKIIRRFGGGKRLVYYSCNRTENNVDFDGLVKGRYGTLGKILGMKGKDMILLLDEAQDLTPTDAQVLKEYYKKHFKSIVLVTTDLDRVTQLNGVTDLLEGNVIRLEELSGEDAIKIVRKRIGNIKLLSDDMIKEIFEKSEKNPRHLLKNCEDVCRQAINNGFESVQKQHLEILK